ncbi:MAG TPA: exodeoxyribonuclease VII small subunit [Candidatus Binataceae bacterium]|jgi:exodeoxyribonuclease VII small subunit
MANQRIRLDDEAARATAAEQLADGVKFEDQLENLESIVTRIDSGELSLEESIDAFEHGVKLVRSLNHKLDEVERRVEVLTRGASGDLKSSAYEGETDGADLGSTLKKGDDVPF